MLALLALRLEVPILLRSVLDVLDMVLLEFWCGYFVNMVVLL